MKDRVIRFRADYDLWEKLVKVAKTEDITVSHLLRRISIEKAQKWAEENE